MTTEKVLMTMSALRKNGSQLGSLLILATLLFVYIRPSHLGAGVYQSIEPSRHSGTLNDETGVNQSEHAGGAIEGTGEKDSFSEEIVVDQSDKHGSDKSSTAVGDEIAMKEIIVELDNCGCDRKLKVKVTDAANKTDLRRYCLYCQTQSKNLYAHSFPHLLQTKELNTS